MNSAFDHLVKHATQPAEPSEPTPENRPGRTFKLLELISQHPGISTEALSKQSGVCSQQIWTRLRRHLARGQVFHESGGWRMSPDAPQLREVHQAIALLKKHGFTVEKPAQHFDPALFHGQRADFIVFDDYAQHPGPKAVTANPTQTAGQAGGEVVAWLDLIQAGLAMPAGFAGMTEMQTWSDAVSALSKLRQRLAVTQQPANEAPGRVDCGECPNVTSGCESGHCMKAKDGAA